MATVHTTVANGSNAPITKHLEGGTRSRNRNTTRTAASESKTKSAHRHSDHVAADDSTENTHHQQQHCVSEATAAWVMHHGVVEKHHDVHNASFPMPHHAPTEVFFETTVEDGGSPNREETSTHEGANKHPRRDRGVNSTHENKHAGDSTAGSTLAVANDNVIVVDASISMRHANVASKHLGVVHDDRSSEDGETQTRRPTEVLETGSQLDATAKSLEDDAISFVDSDIGVRSSASVQVCGLLPSHESALLNPRKRSDYECAMEASRDVDALPPSLISAVNELVIRPLTPSPWMLKRRRQTIERVCHHVTQALRSCGVVCPVAFYVFGSVHLRTVLPDGDNDITVCLLNSSGAGDAGVAGAENTSQDAVSSSPAFPPSGTASNGSQTPTHHYGSNSNNHNVALPPLASSSGANADLLVKVKDYLLTKPSSGIFVDSLVFAEVRVLKLVCDGLSMDFTVGQTGGTSTVCFLHQVDERVDRRHLFKRTLLLLKAWANYEARILGGSGGYLGTYALTVMLMAILNLTLKPAQNGDSKAQTPGSATATTSAAANRGGIDGSSSGGIAGASSPPPILETDNVGESPLALAIRFFAYFSTFDFDRFCVTVFGALPLHLIGTLSQTSGAQRDHENLTPAEDVASSLCSEGSCGPNILTEEFVAECARRFGRGKNAEPAACTPPTAAPIQPSSAFPTVPPLRSGLPPGLHLAQNAHSSNEAVDGNSSSSHGSGAGNTTTTKPAAASAPKTARSGQPSVASQRFSSTLITAAQAFPIRSMNVMDPLRPYSNLSRGVSRAHLMRIQSAMALALHQLRRVEQEIKSDKMDPVAAIHTLFPNCSDTIHELRLFDTMPVNGIVHDEDLPESAFGGIYRCSSCSHPSMLCVREDYYTRPELVAVMPSNTTPAAGSSSGVPPGTTGVTDAPQRQRGGSGAFNSFPTSGVNQQQQQNQQWKSNEIPFQLQQQPPMGNAGSGRYQNGGGYNQYTPTSHGGGPGTDSGAPQYPQASSYRGNNNINNGNNNGYHARHHHHHHHPHSYHQRNGNVGQQQQLQQQHASTLAHYSNSGGPQPSYLGSRYYGETQPQQQTLIERQQPPQQGVYSDPFSNYSGGSRGGMQPIPNTEGSAFPTHVTAALRATHNDYRDSTESHDEVDARAGPPEQLHRGRGGKGRGGHHGRGGANVEDVGAMEIEDTSGAHRTSGDRGGRGRHVTNKKRGAASTGAQHGSQPSPPPPLTNELFPALPN